MKQLPDITKLDLKEYCLFCLKYCENWSNRKRTPGQDQLLQVLFSKRDIGSGGAFKKLFWKVLSRAEATFPNDAEDEHVPKTPTICPDCLGAVLEIRGLYTELERIQMLFLEHISNLQDVIAEGHLQATEWLDDAQLNEQEKPSRESLAKLCEFQEAVIVNSPTEVKVPYILLDKVPAEKVRNVKSESTWNKLTEEVPVKRKRGRPPKAAIIIKNVQSYASHAPVELPVPPRRRRGRPSLQDMILFPKVIPAEVAPQRQTVDFCEEMNDLEDFVNSPLDAAEFIAEDDDEYIPPSRDQPIQKKRGRGRPRKSDSSQPSMQTHLRKRKYTKRRKFSEAEDSDMSSSGAKDGKKKRKRVRFNEIDEEGRRVRKKARHSIFPCTKCRKVFFQYQVFEQHKLCHQNLKENETSPETDTVEESKDCQVCSQDVLESDYNSHMLSHESLEKLPEEDDKLNACSHKDCNRKFFLKENLKIHVDIDHDELNSRCMETIRKCDLCHVCYDTSNDLLQHILKVHKDFKKQKRLLHCPVCGYAFTKQDNLTIHMYSHAATNQSICVKCPVKDRVNFTDRSQYLQHLRNEHGWNTSAQCSICKEEFEDIYWHKVHLQTIHKCKEIMVCSYCGKTCYNATDFMRHYTKTHDKVERTGLLCEFCNEKFPNENRLLHHRVIIHGAPKLACGFCPMEYSTVAGYKAHVKTHTNETEYRCEICNKHFSQKVNLEQHKASHSDSRPYTCETCGAGCKTYWQFRSHRLTHNKQHTCEVCGRKFARGWSLRTHMKMHTGETIPCQYCGYEFHSEKSLKRHMKVYHTGDGTELKPLYPPQKRRAFRTTWKDDDGNTVYAKNVPVPPKTAIKSDSEIGS